MVPVAVSRYKTSLLSLFDDSVASVDRFWLGRYGMGSVTSASCVAQLTLCRCDRENESLGDTDRADAIETRFVTQLRLDCQLDISLGLRSHEFQFQIVAASRHIGW